MPYVVTGATGHLGGLVLEALLARGVQAGQIRALGRNRERLDELAGQGFGTARVDYAQPETLSAAFSAGDQVLLISGSEVGQRVAQHTAIIDAARHAGVARVAYTSVSRADSSSLPLAPEHRQTEIYLQDSGVAFTLLRNNWYTENYASAITEASATGQISANVGAGRVASATRTDYAEAAAAVLTGEGHEGKVYELTGETAWDFNDLAEVASEILGKPVSYVSLTPEEHLAQLTAAGLPAETAQFVVALDQAIKDGALAETTSDLRNLIGHPVTPLQEGLRAAL